VAELSEAKAMRNILLLALLVASPSLAQSRSEVRESRRDVVEERQELNDANRSGDPREVRRESRDYWSARDEYRDDRADYREREAYREGRRDYRGRDDYRDYRNTHARSRYVAPYRGWHYHAVNPGYQLRGGFYGSRYAIANPHYYGLRPTRSHHRWVRYGNDLLLVNVRNGRVLQVLRSRY